MRKAKAALPRATAAGRAAASAAAPESPRRRIGSLRNSTAIQTPFKLLRYKYITIESSITNNRIYNQPPQVRYVLKNLARDWSAECAAERAQSYGRICAELARLFPDRRAPAHAPRRAAPPHAPWAPRKAPGPSHAPAAPGGCLPRHGSAQASKHPLHCARGARPQALAASIIHAGVCIGSIDRITLVFCSNAPPGLGRRNHSPKPASPRPSTARHSLPSPPRVLIPGAGLARLMVEVAALGLEAQGNEFSYYMLLAGGLHAVGGWIFLVHVVAAPVQGCAGAGQRGLLLHAAGRWGSYCPCTRTPL